MFIPAILTLQRRSLEGPEGGYLQLRHVHSSSQGSPPPQKFGIHSFPNNFRRGMTDAFREYFSYSNRIGWNLVSIKFYRHKVKIKFSLYLTKYHATKIYDGMGGINPGILQLGMSRSLYSQRKAVFDRLCGQVVRVSG
jgi:hypothetical protein